MKTITLLALLQVLPVVSLPATTAMGFASAISPYTNSNPKLGYHLEGYVDAQGNVKYVEYKKKTDGSFEKDKDGNLVVANRPPNKLGCSGFVSAVLHRMKFGDKWLAKDNSGKPNYDLRVHQRTGDDIADHFGLKKSVTLSGTKLMAKRNEVPPGLQKDRLYLFSVLSGSVGHTGFVRPKADGTLEQWHFSSRSDGLERGEFRDWITWSKYKQSEFNFYLVPEK